MSGLTLTLKTALSEGADFESALPASWASLPAADLATGTVRLARSGTVALGSLFDISGNPDGTLTFSGDLSRADRVGAGLAGGTVRVQGSVGDRAGAGMTGGRLEISGSAGNSTGEGMAGGAVLVRGNGGHRTGGAAPGRKRGMTGGEIVVLGSVGDETGASMRRGLVAVGGSAGACTGLSIIAGTVVVFGSIGRDAGLWGKRASIVSMGSVEMPATYRYDCELQPVYLRLLLLRLRNVFGVPVTAAQVDGYYRRFSGDFAESGKGEILAWSHQ
jgi:formylmethanofuran dehydrogenase subunit C